MGHLCSVLLFNLSNGKWPRNGSFFPAFSALFHLEKFIAWRKGPIRTQLSRDRNSAAFDRSGSEWKEKASTYTWEWETTVKPKEMYRTSNALSEFIPTKYKFKIISRKPQLCQQYIAPGSILGLSPHSKNMVFRRNFKFKLGLFLTNWKG